VEIIFPILISIDCLQNKKM